MPLVRNDENESAVVQVENHRRRLVQEVLSNRTGRVATQDVHRVLEPNDEWTLVQEQVVAGWGFVQQLLREGMRVNARARFFSFFFPFVFLVCPMWHPSNRKMM